MKFLLTLKHWQLFLLFIGLPLLSAMVGIVFSIILKGMMWPVFFILLTTFLTTGFFMLYQYSVIYHLSGLCPGNAPVNLRLTNICFLINMVIIITMLFIIWKIMHLVTAPAEPNLSLVFVLFFIVLISIASSLYILYAMSKVVVTAELQRPVTFSDHALEFILFWFWIVGIWVLQPRINEIVAYSSRGKGPPPLPNDEVGQRLS